MPDPVRVPVEPSNPVAQRIFDEIDPLIDQYTSDGGYDCCGCSTYDQIMWHAISIANAYALDYDTMYGGGGVTGRWRRVYDWLVNEYGEDMITSPDSELHLGHAREVIAIVAQGIAATAEAALDA